MRRRSTVRVIFSFLSIFVSSRGRNSSRNDALESCANLRVVGRRRRRRLEDGLAFVVVRAFGSKNALPFFPVVVSRRRRLLGTMVVTWDLESSRIIVPLRNASRERESEISARVVGTRKGGAAAKRQRTESQRATMTLRSKEGAFFFVLDQVFYGWLRSKTKNVFSVLVWSFFLSFFLSLVLTRAFFCTPQNARRHELGAAALDPSVRFIQVQPVGELDFSAGEARVDAVPSDNREAFAQV